jgi:hypothetical protein
VRTRGRVAVVAALLAVAAVPLVASAWRARGDERCAEDAVRIDPRYRVEVVSSRRGTEAYCSVRCAERRLRRAAVAPREVLVTDETTGRRVPAESAWFVESAVVTDAATGNRVHVFAEEADARRHAASFHGTVLPGAPWTAAPSSSGGPP